MKGTPGYRYYFVLRWLGLLTGLGVCAAVLYSSWRTLPCGDVLLLGLLGAAARFRPVVLRPQATAQMVITYQPGESLAVIALLRDGPAAALAVSLVATVLTLPFQHVRLFKRPLESFDGALSTPALFWVAGVLYAITGGHPLVAPADSALLFQRPAAIVLPLLLALFVTQDLIYRGSRPCCFSAATPRWCARTCAT